MGHTIGGQETIEEWANDRCFKSQLDFARFLHELHPSKSIEGWRGAIQRWQKTTKQTFQTIERMEEDLTPSTTKIYYDKANDKYITVLASTKEFITIDGDTHRNMKKAYSKEGKNYNIKQMSQEFNFPTAWISDYIRSHDWTHNMDIFSNEEIQTRTLESLSKEIIESKRNKVLEDANKKLWRGINKDADRMRVLDVTMLNEFKDAISNKNMAFATPKLLKLGKSKPYAVVLSPTDLHYGKGGWVDEVGEEYNLKEARKRLLDRTNNLINRFPGRPEKIIIATGSDWFHVDNEEGTTTAGTPQDTAASPAQILIDGCKLAREHIDMLRQVTSVEVVFMRGNHDRHTSLALMLYLDAVYENCDDVTITVSPKLRQYITWGNNLLGFTHGDGVKGTDLPAIMATEERNAWGKHEHHVWFHGHLHHQKLLETSGVTIVQLPSLAGHDRYHYKKGFVLSRAGLSAHLLDKQLGLIGNLFAPVITHE